LQQQASVNLFLTKIESAAYVFKIFVIICDIIAWTRTNSAIFLFSTALCSTVQSWVWLACYPNLYTKDLEITPCQYSRFSTTPYFSSASQNTLFSVSLYLSPWWPPLLSAPWFFRDYGAL